MKHCVNRVTGKYDFITVIHLIFRVKKRRLVGSGGRRRPQITAVRLSPDGGLSPLLRPSAPDAPPQPQRPRTTLDPEAQEAGARPGGVFPDLGRLARTDLPSPRPAQAEPGLSIGSAAANYSPARPRPSGWGRGVVSFLRFLKM